MKTRAESIREMCPLFHQAGEGGSIPTSALQLHVGKIEFGFARELNRLWHSRLPRIGTGCIRNMPFLCFAATFEDVVYAIGIWSNPVARNLPQDTWLELRRLAVGPQRPRNTCSRMLAIMRRLIRKERPKIQNLISYQDLGIHTGTIYKAAGWKPTVINRDGNWTRAKRPRPRAQSETAKQRWERSVW